MFDTRFHIQLANDGLVVINKTTIFIYLDKSENNIVSRGIIYWQSDRFKLKYSNHQNEMYAFESGRRKYILYQSVLLQCCIMLQMENT